MPMPMVMAVVSSERCHEATSTFFWFDYIHSVTQCTTEVYRYFRSFNMVVLIYYFYEEENLFHSLDTKMGRRWTKTPAQVTVPPSLAMDGYWWVNFVRDKRSSALYRVQTQTLTIWRTTALALAVVMAVAVAAVAISAAKAGPELLFLCK
jgi:hypothetical protein